MILLATVAFQTARAPDTIGLQPAFDRALLAVYRRTIPKGLFANAVHIVVDQQSFQKLAGIDTTAAVDWSSLGTRLGKQGTAIRTQQDVGRHERVT